MDDSSHNMNIQLAYAPGDNWGFQVTWQLLAGDTYTQYGENVVASKTVVDINYSF
ncbi:MAG: hypothetical protein GY866_21935 [Proteobacteria bacterium]|nr:hypothetical protein [Pseudomonadota bacterium]